MDVAALSGPQTNTVMMKTTMLGVTGMEEHAATMIRQTGTIGVPNVSARTPTLSQPQLQQLPQLLLPPQQPQLLLQFVKIVAIGANVNARERRPRVGVTGSGSRRTARRLVDFVNQAGWPLLSESEDDLRLLFRDDLTHFLY